MSDKPDRYRIEVWRAIPGTSTCWKKLVIKEFDDLIDPEHSADRVAVAMRALLGLTNNETLTVLDTLPRASREAILQHQKEQLG
jgi:DNA-directed RNA polymerase specialized sigma24 family protein